MPSQATASPVATIQPADHVAYRMYTPAVRRGVEYAIAAEYPLALDAAGLRAAAERLRHQKRTKARAELEDSGAPEHARPAREDESQA